MTELQVFWWLKLDSILTFVQIVAFISGLFLVIVLIYTAVGFCSSVDDEDRIKYKKAHNFLNRILLPTTTVILVLSVLCVLIPTTKQYTVIKVFPKIVNNEVIQQIPDDLKDMYSIAKEYVKDIVKK